MRDLLRARVGKVGFVLGFGHLAGWYRAVRLGCGVTTGGPWVNVNPAGNSEVVAFWC
jgi:hypothetical protein